MGLSQFFSCYRNRNLFIYGGDKDVNFSSVQTNSRFRLASLKHLRQACFIFSDIRSSFLPFLLLRKDFQGPRTFIRMFNHKEWDLFSMRTDGSENEGKARAYHIASWKHFLYQATTHWHSFLVFIPPGRKSAVTSIPAG